MELFRNLLVTLFFIHTVPLWNGHQTVLARAEVVVMLTQSVAGAKTGTATNKRNMMLTHDIAVTAFVATAPDPNNTVTYPHKNNTLRTRATTTPPMYT